MITLLHPAVPYQNDLLKCTPLPLPPKVKKTRPRDYCGPDCAYAFDLSRDVADMSLREDDAQWPEPAVKSFLILYQLYGQDYCKIARYLGPSAGHTCRSVARYYKRNKARILRAVEERHRSKAVHCTYFAFTSAWT